MSNQPLYIFWREITEVRKKASGCSLILLLLFVLDYIEFYDAWNFPRMHPAKKPRYSLSTAAISREKLGGWCRGMSSPTQWSLTPGFVRDRLSRSMRRANGTINRKAKLSIDVRNLNKSKSLHAAHPRESTVLQSLAVCCESKVSLISNDWFLPPLLSAFADNSVRLDRAISLENLDDEMIFIVWLCVCREITISFLCANGVLTFFFGISSSSWNLYRESFVQSLRISPTF